MAKIKKLLRKARQGPQNLRLKDLIKIAETYDFHIDRQKGSHIIMVHPAYPDIINLQEAEGGKAKKYQVNQVLRIIEDLEENYGYEL